MAQRLFLLFLVSWFSLPITAQSADGKTALADYIKTLEKNTELKGASIGIYAMFQESDQEILQYNAETGMVTASSMKAVTTATALLQLGKDFKFETLIIANGTVDSLQGILKGDLVIRSWGDPTLGSEKYIDTKAEKFLAKVLQSLQSKGIKSIQGNIVADGSAFEPAMAVPTWLWEDIGNHFGAGVWGVNWRDNIYYLYFNTGATTGDSTIITKTSPANLGIEFINEIKTGPPGSGDEGYIFGAEYSYTRYVRGTLPPGKKEYSIKGSLPDPALCMSDELKNYLVANGIQVSGIAKTSRNYVIPVATENVLGKWKSPSLGSIIKMTNVHSNNQYAEALHKYLGYITYGVGSNEYGNKSIVAYWEKQKIGPGGFIIADGAGLSRSTSISAKNLTKMMDIMAESSVSETFMNSLPVAGVSGTLKNVGKSTTLENNLTAKSGSMSKVRAYTGYITNPDGKRIVFTLLFNNYLSSSKSIKQIMEDLILKISEVR